ncbi:DNA damage-responsive transcriptional repressor RPH1 [Candida viswanathii]|uniref:[histone H3]-trimethyl-L-lysine(9) demethylase n=1 Tax=Candida viswanathii TaxID=5486 RepID=A0A367XZH4_9ASCO|nr:DNA damage-responsive transcriptional repressor RPH1 [Candida viswanathii]
MQSSYQHDSSLHIEPHHFENGVPVFLPTYQEFENFYSFNKAINKYGMSSGIVKVIPPKEWSDEVRAKCYTLENLASILIRNPILQNVNMNQPGVFQFQNVERLRKYSIFRWKELAKKYQPPKSKLKKETKEDGESVESTREVPDYTIDASEFTDERCEELEKTYWKSLPYSAPMYGADSLGSLFRDKIDVWNVSKLPNILDLMDVRLPGVNEAYLYGGLWKSSFAWHLEDQDLYLINYLHFGAPKKWYLIPQSQHEQFYQVMKSHFEEEWKNCSEFLRHKTFMMSPATLEKLGVQVNQIVHREGEFIITYPYGYHAGFNLGFNLAESVNFALDDWFEFGKNTKKCECISDSVGINIPKLWKNFYGTKYPESDSEDEAEEEEKVAAVPKKKTEIRIIDDSDLETAIEMHDESDVESIMSDHSIEVVKVTRNKRNPRKRKLRNVQEEDEFEEEDSECYLCPNNFQNSRFKSSPMFDLLKTDMPPLEVHRLCANMFPEQLSYNKTTKSVVGLNNISKQQMKLQCSVCRKRGIGACFQCNFKRCARSYHGSCGLSDGVKYLLETGEVRCKHHNKGADNSEDLVKSIKVGSFVQFVFNKGVFAGKVVNLHDNPGHFVEIEVYPLASDIIEVPIENIINPNACFIDGRNRFNYLGNPST